MMLRRVRITKAALAFGFTVAVWFVVFGTVCSVDRAGLSNGDASVSAGGSGGKLAAAGGAPATGGTVGASGNSGAGGTVSGGSGGSGGTISTTAGNGGTNPAGGTGGITGGTGGGSGGAIGTGGASSGSGGDQGLAGNGSGGAAGAGGDSSGNAGTAGGSGGDTSAGGVPGSGGAAGAGTGGAAGTQGSGGMIGSGGTGGTHPPSCSSFPSGSTFTPPTATTPHCYWTHADQVTWEAAEATCEGEGGTLATVLSSMENMTVLQLGLRAALFAGGTNVAWLGANDGKQSNDKSGPGKYAWVTGEAWGYINWHSSQPDGSCTCQLNNMCACDHWLAIANDGTWYDRDDSSGRPFICEAVAR